MPGRYPTIAQLENVAWGRKYLDSVLFHQDMSYGIEDCLRFNGPLGWSVEFRYPEGETAGQKDDLVAVRVLFDSETYREAEGVDAYTYLRDMLP